jgi:16S rRNA (guanine527-N7)-methyltransferase
VSSSGAALRLNQVLVESGLEPLDLKTASQFELYLSLILRWNTRLNLTSVRTEDAIIFRHLAESIACARALPGSVATLLDFGSGAGLPGIPIALCRPEIATTLAESQGKKAAFLQEAVRVLGIRAKVHANRAEEISDIFDCVVLRAVDKMPKAVALATHLVAPEGWLALMTTGAEIQGLQTAAGSEFRWSEQIRLPRSTDRLLAFATRA